MKLTDQPVAYSVLAKAVVTMIVLLGVVDWTTEQAVGVLAVFDAFLGVLVIQSTTAKPKVEAKVEDATATGYQQAVADVSSLHSLAMQPPPPKKAPVKAARKR